MEPMPMPDADVTMIIIQIQATWEWLGDRNLYGVCHRLVDPVVATYVYLFMRIETKTIKKVRPKAKGKGEWS